MIQIILASFLSGLTASMGLGGGMILILYLTLILGIPQIEAQGINLIFFIPIATISVILHNKKGLIPWKKIIPAIIAGIITALLASRFSNRLSNNHLKKLFGMVVITIGIIQFFKAMKDLKK